MENSMRAIQQNRQRGFTLIEVMIVVAIVAILASVALPSYQESVRRSNRAQATATLLEASNWLQRNYTIANTYVLPTTPATTLATAGFGQSPKDGTAKYTITFSVAPSATGYTLQAVPAATDKCGTFTLDETGKRTSGGVLADCWGGH